MALGMSPPPEIRSLEGRGAAEEHPEAYEEEEVFDDAFDIPHKNAPHYRLRWWRQAALALNASRRFRYTLDLKKEEEKEMIRRKIRSQAQVIRSAFLFKEAGQKDIRGSRRGAMEGMEGLATAMSGELQVQHHGCSLTGGSSSSLSVVVVGNDAVRCPRCDSPNTKFCYYSNYSLSQPRYFCKTCRRYWTKGGALRNVPVGGGCRKTRCSGSTAVAATASNEPRREAFYGRVRDFLDHDGIGRGFDEQYLDSLNQDITHTEAIHAGHNLSASPIGAANSRPFDGGRIWFSGDGEGDVAHGAEYFTVSNGGNRALPATLFFGGGGGGFPYGRPFESEHYTAHNSEGSILPGNLFTEGGSGGVVHDRPSNGTEYFAASNGGNRVLHATLLSGGGVPYGRPFGGEYYTANNGEGRIRPGSLFTGGGGGDGRQVDGGSDILDVPVLQTSSATNNEDIRITIDNADGGSTVDGRGATGNTNESDCIDKYTIAVLGLFFAAAGNGWEAYSVIEKAAGPKFAPLVYGCVCAPVGLLGTAAIAGLVCGKSPKSKVFSKYAMLLSIVVFIGLAIFVLFSLIFGEKDVAGAE